jgi:hypothetical protein
MAGTKKLISMSKFAIIMICIGLAFSSCEKYEEYMVDYRYSAVYFPHASIDRTVIVGEYMDIGVGIFLGGRIENNAEEWASYMLDPDVLSGTDYKLLPEKYYSLDNNEKIIISKGEFNGFATVSINQDLFCADSLALSSTYALGFRLLDTSVDTILSDMQTTIITFKYINTYDGNYYHKGKAVGFVDGSPVDTMKYPADDFWNLSTFSPNGVTAPEMGNISGDDYRMDLVIKPDNSVSIVINPNAGNEVQSGTGQYYPETRTFILEYSFQHEGKNYQANDTLLFRNRIVDGVNQWDI